MVVSKRAADRRDDILALIRDRNRVYVTELSEKFQVSEVTIRKDLQELEQRGVAKRVHGGAINIYNTGIEPTLKELEQTNTDLKLAIAAKAFEYISDQDVLFLDASTTTRCLIPLICKHPEKKLTIFFYPDSGRPFRLRTRLPYYAGGQCAQQSLLCRRYLYHLIHP